MLSRRTSYSAARIDWTGFIMRKAIAALMLFGLGITIGWAPGSSANSLAEQKPATGRSGQTRFLAQSMPCVGAGRERARGGG